MALIAISALVLTVNWETAYSWPSP